MVTIISKFSIKDYPECKTTICICWNNFKFHEIFLSLRKLEGDVPIAQRANLAALEAASEVQITLEVQHTDVLAASPTDGDTIAKG